jgi:hypothetical protein
LHNIARCFCTVRAAAKAGQLLPSNVDVDAMDEMKSSQSTATPRLRKCGGNLEGSAITCTDFR